MTGQMATSWETGLIFFLFFPTFLQVEETSIIAEALLGDLSRFSTFKRDLFDLLEELQNWRQDQFDEWARDMQAQIDDASNPLR